MIKTNLNLLFPLLLSLVGCEKINEFFGGENNHYNSGNVEAETLVADTSIGDSFEWKEAEDYIADVSFDRTIRIVFSPSGATVSGDANGIVSVSGNHVTADNTSFDEKVRYELSGTAADGSFKLYGANKQALVLDGLDLTNPSGAAINNQSKKRTFVVLQGSNSLADGAEYTGTPADEDEKAAFFSEGQLVFSGSGSLTVNASGKAGVTSDDYVRVLEGTLKVGSASGHGLRGKDAVIISGGSLEIKAGGAGKKGISSDGTVRFDGGSTTITVSGGVDATDASDISASAGVKADVAFLMNAGELTITNSGQGGKGISGDADGLFAGGTVRVSVTGGNYGTSSSGGFRPGWGSSSSSDNSKSAKAIKFDGKLVITGGTISASAKSHEAIEAKGQMVITGGDVYAYSSDDAINSGSHMVIDGGRVCAWSTGNDGLDANGNCYIQGGLVYAIGSGTPEVAIDANSEGGYRLNVTGGTLAAIGGLESGAALGQDCYSANWSAGTWYTLYDGSKAVFSFQTPKSGGSGLVVSVEGKDPALKSGTSVSGGTTLFEGIGAVDATVSGGSSVSLSAYSGGAGMGFGGPGGGFGGPGGWW